MDDITVIDMLKAQERFASMLDPDKNCSTCVHEGKKADESPCNVCFNEAFCLPLNPTSWKAKPNTEVV